MALISELKRRNVFRVALLYIIASWLILQVADVLLEQLGVPGWAFRLVLGLLVIGFPLVVIFSWVFEVTPEGIKRENEVESGTSVTHTTGQRINHLIVVLLLLTIITVIADRFIPTATDELASNSANPVAAQAVPAAPVEVSDHSIAVLPFVNMSGDPDNEYFSDGLTEELLNALAKVGDLKVTGRTSSFAFKGKNSDLREIGKALNVAHILEGSVRKVHNRVRITAQLIKVDDGYHLWSETFDRELDDIFAVQEEIATRVATELDATLLGGSAGQLTRTGTRNTAAWEAYLQGMHILQQGLDDEPIRRQAEQQFQRAIAMDPAFTLAWYGQFRVLNWRQRAGVIPFQSAAIRMRELADKLVAMDPQLPESYLAQARISLVEMHWQDTQAAYEQVLRLNPGNVQALSGLVGLFGVLNQPVKALEYAQQALERDPLDITVLTGVAGGYRAMGRCDEQERLLKRVLELQATRGRVYAVRALCLLEHGGDAGKAVAFLRLESVGFLRETGLAIAYFKLGKRNAAQQALDVLIRENGEAASYQFAEIYAQWGQPEKALDALEHAYTIRDPGFVLINSDRLLDPLRNTPRFAPLLEKWRDPSK